jgi:polysaccharide biosynthesis transport protein
MRETFEQPNTDSSEERTLVVPAESGIPLQSVLSYGEEAHAESKTNLGDYWRAVRKRLWLVTCITVLTVTITAIYMARQPDIYQAKARVYIDRENNNPTLGTGKNNSVIFNNPVNDPAYFNTQLQILTSPGLLRRVTKILDLEHNPTFLSSRSTQADFAWRGLSGLVGRGSAEKEQVSNQINGKVPPNTLPDSGASSDDPGESKRLAPFVSALQRGLDVEPVKETRLSFKETRLIDIFFSHFDPEIASKVANAVADTFVLSNLEKKTETNSTRGDFLRKQIAEIQAKIRNGEERLINYAKNHHIISLNNNQDTVAERLVGLNRQVLEAETRRYLAEANYRGALSPYSVEALLIERSSEFSPAEVKLGELQVRRAELLTEVTEEWPAVKAIDRQISVLEKQINEGRKRALSSVLSGLETRYRQALTHERAVRAAFDRQRSETLGQNEAAINYRIIQQEIETNRELLAGLLESSKENELAIAGTANNIKVIDYATAFAGPVGPERLMIMGLAFIFSLALGVVLALLLDRLDDTVCSVEDVEKFLRLPALATIPLMKHSASPTFLPDNGDSTACNGSESDQSKSLTDADTRCLASEVFRQLRTSVLLSPTAGTPKTLLVTSSLPGEGKTTISINLALCLAQTGDSVLLVDADLRRSKIHSIFGIKNTYGLSSLLTREVKAVEALTAIEQYQLTKNLYLLPGGPVPPNPSELLGSGQMRHLLDIYESAFTYLIIDSPPIAFLTDSVLLSSMVDGVLLVVNGGKCSKEVVQRSQKMLTSVGAKIYGVVLNSVSEMPQYYHLYRDYFDRSRVR